MRRGHGYRTARMRGRRGHDRDRKAVPAPVAAGSRRRRGSRAEPAVRLAAETRRGRAPGAPRRVLPVLPRGRLRVVRGRPVQVRPRREADTMTTSCRYCLYESRNDGGEWRLAWTGTDSDVDPF